VHVWRSARARACTHLRKLFEYDGKLRARAAVWPPEDMASDDGSESSATSWRAEPVAVLVVVSGGGGSHVMKISASGQLMLS